MIGIYKITNKVNGNAYVGQSCHVKRRFMEHVTPRNLAKTHVLAKAFRKHGKDAFEFSLLEKCAMEDLDARERHWISELKPRYNMNEGGNGNAGFVHTPETRKGLSKAGRKLWDSMSEEKKREFVKSNLKGPKVGHSVSAETRQKLRLKNLGKKQSVETVEKRAKKMSVSMQGNTSGNKQVAQFSLGGMLLGVFDSVKSAARSVGINPSNISAHLKGRQASAGGYEWLSGHSIPFQDKTETINKQLELIYDTASSS